MENYTVKFIFETQRKIITDNIKKGDRGLIFEGACSTLECSKCFLYRKLYSCALWYGPNKPKNRRSHLLWFIKRFPTLLLREEK